MLSSCLRRCPTHKLAPRRVENSAHQSFDFKTRAFCVGLAGLLLLAALYTALVLGAWARTPLGQRPQGEAAAWLADAESLYNGTTPREPFFRAPAYLTALALLREVGVPAAGLAPAARVLNGWAHILSTALMAGIGWRFWRRRGALVACALWGFYPAAVFMATQPGPDSLALLAWLGGVATALGVVWQSPMWAGGRPSHCHAWIYPTVAGIAFALAAAFSATYWPTALAWPLVAVMLGPDARGSRMLASLVGVGAVVAAVVLLQNFWGGSPQPLAGADIYRLAQALEVTQPLAAPLPAVESPSRQPARDGLEQETLLAYEMRMKKPPESLAVLDGYWWRAAAQSATVFPAHSAWRAVKKAFQLLGADEFSVGPDYARARAEVGFLRYNPLDWGVLFALGVAGLVLGWRSPATGLATVLATLAAAGGLLWYPTLEARAPVAALLALLAGGIVAWPWPPARRNKAILSGLVPAAILLVWWPRPNSPAAILAARDSRERAGASAALGDYDRALLELANPDRAALLTFSDRDLAAGWRFSKLLKNLPALPSPAELEGQLLDNANLATESPAAQFRSGACLWLLGRVDGALYFWENLANGNNAWGAAARAALAASGRETPAQSQRRAAWEIGGGPQPDPSLAPFFAKMRATPTAPNPPAQ
jgi:hypothetical protein